MGKAKEVCPELVILPYDYENIRRVGNQNETKNNRNTNSAIINGQISHLIYEIVQRFTPIIQVGSCDELYCDLSQYLQNNQFLNVCSQIKYKLHISIIIYRRQIFEESHCRCSIGISHNLTACRIATKRYEHYERLIH